MTAVPARGPHPSLLGIDLSERALALSPSLDALAETLERDAQQLLARDAPIPTVKAQLTRAGGRCAADGTLLVFDPWQPEHHRCPSCEAVYSGADHHAWWAMSAQLWCAERALTSALLGSMLHKPQLLALSQRMIDTWSDRWSRYPNIDNALGPTRPFFSTYLESAWLLQVTLAAGVLRSWEPALASCDRFASRVVEPSRDLIASFPEGASNRQCWHTAAQLAAAAFLGDSNALPSLLDGPVGVLTLLDKGLLTDGSWYEGENYHLFAHRGLWYGVMLMQSRDAPIPDRLMHRFTTGFRAPFLTLLPDHTFPSRRDSRYAVSVHQWRFAEWCELAMAHAPDPLIGSWLQQLYVAPLAAGDSGRARSTGEIEHDTPPVALSRRDLSWKSLLCARPEPWADTAQRAPTSVLLPAQGIAILRADEGAIYVSMETGQTGGGHGHPDRLGLVIQDGVNRVLEDPGAGSYVDRSLHWYRSTLAHSAPLLQRQSQQPNRAELLAYDSFGNNGWIQARLRQDEHRATCTRTVVLSDDHLVDCLSFTAESAVTLDLPVHLDGSADASLVWDVADPNGAGGLEDGFEFLSDVECAVIHAGELLEIDARHSACARCWYSANVNGFLWRAMAPGPPGHPRRKFYWIRLHEERGSLLGLWSLRDSVRSVTMSSDPAHSASVDVSLRGGCRIRHIGAPQEWRITRVCDGVSNETVLRTHRTGDGADGEFTASNIGAAPTTSAAATASLNAATSASTNTVAAHALHERVPHPFRLSKAHYRASEQTWDEANQPSAEVTLELNGDSLHVSLFVHTGTLALGHANAPNTLDNERPDINLDGVQLYVGPVGAATWSDAWLMVPDDEKGTVRITSLATPQSPLVSRAPQQEPWVPQAVRWRRTRDGWELHCQLACSQLPVNELGELLLDLVVNEKPAGRLRRRGQLLLSGARGERVYLRGDRHDPTRALLFTLPSLARPKE